MLNVASKALKYYLFGCLLSWWIQLPTLVPWLRNGLPFVSDLLILLSLLVGGLVMIAAIFESLK
jgi:hypothetical protein